jgi:hypothetical protein
MMEPKRIANVRLDVRSGMPLEPVDVVLLLSRCRLQSRPFRSLFLPAPFGHNATKHHARIVFSMHQVPHEFIFWIAQCECERWCECRVVRDVQERRATRGRPLREILRVRTSFPRGTDGGGGGSHAVVIGHDVHRCRRVVDLVASLPLLNGAQTPPPATSYCCGQPAQIGTLRRK